ncbi:MAG: aminopeptidase [Candidatus Latescibacterota bacterium]
MNAIESGAKQAVVNCAKVTPEEKVIIITDRQTEHLANALQKEVKTIGASVQQFVMETFGARPDDGSHPIPFPKEIGDALSVAQVSFYIAGGKKGELHSFRIPMLEVIERHGLRHGHMPNFSEVMMSQGMAADYELIQKICRKVYDIVATAKAIHVTTPAGSDFTATFSAKRKWMISDGNIRPEKWCNLPDGEVYTAPLSANGHVVIDGCLGDYFNAKYGKLNDSPLSYDVKEGRCTRGSVRCKNELLKKEFEEYTFETDEHSDRMGEFAIGTNVNLTDLIGNMLQDEKFPGIHVALGDPYPTKTGADWSSKAHNDGVMLKPTIVVDGRTIMKAGSFTI